MRLDQFIINYNGNKYRESKQHLSHLKLGNYDVIAEPFCGIFGFSRAYYELNPGFTGKFWLNDIDNELIEIFNRIKADPNKFINEIVEELSKYSTDSELSRDKTKSRALELISCGMTPNLCQIKKGNAKIKGFINKLPLYAEFFKRVEFFNMKSDDFIKHCEDMGHKTFYYFDPPYFNSSNVSYNKYAHNEEADYRDGTQIYVDIYNHFKNKGNCIMVLNSIAFINYFFKDYIYKICDDGVYNGIGLSKNNVGNARNKKRHIIYANFEPAVVRKIKLIKVIRHPPL